MAKRGRKAGSVSFCKISLSELNRVLKPTAQVIVSLKYAEMVGLHGSMIEADTSYVKALAENASAQIDVENFDGEIEVNGRFGDDGEDIDDQEVESDGSEYLKPVIMVENFN
jgi:hypothetical protein